MPTADEWTGALPNLKKVGSQWQGPCPVCGGRDRFRVLTDGKAFCRMCCPDGGNVDALKAIMDAAGLEKDRPTNGEAVGVVGFTKWWK